MNDLSKPQRESLSTQQREVYKAYKKIQNPTVEDIAAATNRTVDAVNDVILNMRNKGIFMKLYHEPVKESNIKEIKIEEKKTGYQRVKELLNENEGITNLKIAMLTGLRESTVGVYRSIINSKGSNNEESIKKDKGLKRHKGHDKLLDYLQKSPNASYKEMVRDLDLTRNTIHAYLGDLRKMGLLKDRNSYQMKNNVTNDSEVILHVASKLMSLTNEERSIVVGVIVKNEETVKSFLSLSANDREKLLKIIGALT